MPENPLFTIITVSYNNGKTISQTIQSVLSQTFSGFEYLVIDGGSTDETLGLLESFGEQISWVSEADNGIYDAMNKGWKRAKGQWIAFLNADDFYENNQVLANLKHTIESHPEAWALYGDLAYVDSVNTNKIVRYWQSGPYKPEYFLSGWMPPHPTFFIRKEAFEKFGGFRDSELFSAADYEFMLRMLYVNRLPAAYCPHLLVKMRTGGESNRTVKNRIRGNKEDQKAWKLNGVKPGLFTLILKPLRKIPQYWKRP